MFYEDRFIVIGVGALFIVLGIAAVIWGVKEEKAYYNGLAMKFGDMREFVERSPHHPQPLALKIGGWISIAVGVVMICTAVFSILLKG